MWSKLRKIDWPLASLVSSMLVLLNLGLWAIHPPSLREPAARTKADANQELYSLLLQMKALQPLMSVAAQKYVDARPAAELLTACQEFNELATQYNELVSQVNVLQQELGEKQMGYSLLFSDDYLDRVSRGHNLPAFEHDLIKPSEAVDDDNDDENP